MLQPTLPKWPQMIVSGKSVTIDQAKEIIFRTETFFTEASPYSGGNCHDFNRKYRDSAGLNAIQVLRNSPDGARTWTDVDWDRQDYLRRQLGVVLTRYVNNDWASSSFVGGPHGWCHPDGTIAFLDNVGKWPSLAEIVEDWTDIVNAFPYLDLHVTLMSGESGDPEAQPLVNIRVVDGRVTVEEPDLTVHVGVVLTRPDPEAETAMWIARVRNSYNELGLLMSWYEEFAERVKQVVETM